MPRTATARWHASRCALAPPNPLTRALTARDPSSAAHRTQGASITSGTLARLGGIEESDPRTSKSFSCPAPTDTIGCACPRGGNRAPAARSRRTPPHSALVRLAAPVGAPIRPPHRAPPTDWWRRAPPVCIGRLWASGGGSARPWRQRASASRRHRPHGAFFGLHRGGAAMQPAIGLLPCFCREHKKAATAPRHA